MMSGLDDLDSVLEEYRSLREEKARKEAEESEIRKNNRVRVEEVLGSIVQPVVASAAERLRAGGHETDVKEHPDGLELVLIPEDGILSKATLSFGSEHPDYDEIVAQIKGLSGDIIGTGSVTLEKFTTEWAETKVVDFARRVLVERGGLSR